MVEDEPGDLLAAVVAARRAEAERLEEGLREGGNNNASGAPASGTVVEAFVAAAIIGLAPLSLAGASKSVQDAVMNTGLFSRMAIYGVRKEAVLVRPPTASPRTGARSASGSSRPS